MIRVRLEMAKFLQDTLHESPLKANARIVGTEEFKEFFRKVRLDRKQAGCSFTLISVRSLGSLDRGPAVLG